MTIIREGEKRKEVNYFEFLANGTTNHDLWNAVKTSCQRARQVRKVLYVYEAGEKLYLAEEMPELYIAQCFPNGKVESAWEIIPED